MSIRFVFILLFVSIHISSCLVIENQHTGLAPGKWRAVLELDPKVAQKDITKAPLSEIRDVKFEEVTDGELPFVFEVIYEDGKDFHIEIINGEERIKVTDIEYGRDITNGDDTIRIDFPIYDSHLIGKYEEGVFAGDWVVRNRKDYAIPFVARHGQDHRFTQLRKTPKIDLTGKWKTTFSLDDDPYPAIGQFKQTGNQVEGTFLTETGDYRFLEGTIQDNKLYLSCFDGSHAFLFEGKILEDETMIGTFRSGKHWRTTWEAKRNSDYELPSPDSLTYLNEGYETLAFSFENIDGKSISLEDEKYQGKAKLVQIMGTWCPNCRDETKFLVDYFKKNPTKNLEIITIAFEKYRDKTKAFNALRTYKEKFGMDYELLLGGYSNKKEAAAALPMLNHVLSYPTLIFLDKNNKVQRIHTGFNGPATSEYNDFVKGFEQSIALLLK